MRPHTLSAQFSNRIARSTRFRIRAVLVQLVLFLIHEIPAPQKADALRIHPRAPRSKRVLPDVALCQCGSKMLFHPVDAFLLGTLWRVDPGAEEIELADTKPPEKQDRVPLQQLHCAFVMILNVAAVDPIGTVLTKGE